MVRIAIRSLIVTGRFEDSAFRDMSSAGSRNGYKPCRQTGRATVAPVRCYTRDNVGVVACMFVCGPGNRSIVFPE